MRVWILELVDPDEYEGSIERLGVYSSKKAARPDYIGYVREHADSDSYEHGLTDDELIEDAGRTYYPGRFTYQHTDGALEISAGGYELRLSPVEVTSGRRNSESSSGTR